MIRRHVVVFARAPRLGTVKRRLARDIGQVAAWRFHRLTTGALLDRLAADPRWVTWLAVTPDRAAVTGRGLWPAPRSPVPRSPVPRSPVPRSPVQCRRLAQGSGDLGARMGRVLRGLPPGPAVIVGSDIPDIRRRHLGEAFRRLGACDWVLGPAEDGGYWLIGARRRPTLRLPFSGVRWGGRHALADTLANLKGQSVALLETLADVDSGADFARLGQATKPRPRVLQETRDRRGSSPSGRPRDSAS